MQCEPLLSQPSICSSITLEPPVRGVELEHVDHVVDGDEGVVDGHDGGALGDGRAKHQATDATETVDADLKG